MVSSTRPAGTEDAGEVAQVLADGEVCVDRGRLRHVGDATPQRGGAGLFAEHGDRAALDDLHADDRAQERGLSRAARSEDPGHAAAADVERHARQHERPATANAEIANHDGGVIHRHDNMAMDQGAPQIDGSRRSSCSSISSSSSRSRS